MGLIPAILYPQSYPIINNILKIGRKCPELRRFLLASTRLRHSCLVERPASPSLPEEDFGSLKGTKRSAQRVPACQFNGHHSRRGVHSSRQRSSWQSFVDLRSLPNLSCTATHTRSQNSGWNCEWGESVPGIAIDESKRGFPGINHLRIFSNLWFVKLVWQQRRRLVEHRR